MTRKTLEIRRHEFFPFKKGETERTNEELTMSARKKTQIRGEHRNLFFLNVEKLMTRNLKIIVCFFKSLSDFVHLFIFLVIAKGDAKKLKILKSKLHQRDIKMCRVYFDERRRIIDFN